MKNAEKSRPTKSTAISDDRKEMFLIDYYIYRSALKFPSFSGTQY
jgi:hypothetical protein